MSTRTAVIVQARYGSTRLPGKVMKTLAGRTVLEHVLERCKAVPGADVVCCATTGLAADDSIADAAAALDVEVFRGSEDDVLNRYARTAAALDADIVLRVTSDCPLIDPAICGAVLSLRASVDADFACNNMPPSWPHGLDCEVFTRGWLERADREATAPAEREHVGPYVRTHAAAKKANLPCPEQDLAGHGWTLDTPDDLAFLEKLFAQLPGGTEGWDWHVPLDIVRNNPAMTAINATATRAAG